MTAGMLSGQRVAVVGGGLAGLAAALECADLGAQVTVLERRRRLGGLTWSFDHNGVAMDNGQHVYLACCDAYIRFLGRIGAAGDVVAPAPLDIPVVAPGPRSGGRPVVGRLARRRLPVPLHLAGSLMRFPHLPLPDRLLLGRALLGLARLDLTDPALDRITFGEWLAARGQSQAAIAAVWDLITIPTVNLPAAEASLAAAAMVFKTGLLSRPDAADIGWSAVPLGQLHGQRAAAALDRAGVEVRTGVRVGVIDPVRIDQADGARGWRIGAEDGSLEVDRVVVAVPHPEAAALVPEDASPGRDRWVELGSSAIVDVHLIFDRPVTRWPLMAGVESPVQWVFDRSASGLGPQDPDRAPDRQYLAVSLSAADHLMGVRPETLVETTVAELGRLLPAVPSARLVDSAVTKERQATFRAGPGSGALRPGPTTAQPGLVLAGAWTDTGWPATMEGAVRSGIAAARALAGARAGQPSSLSPLIPQEVA